MTVLLAVALGLAAGLVAGLFGVGGGILFVPALLLLGLDQHHAQATSLLAIVPVVLAGSWRQQRYGNLRWRAALVVGLGSLPGVALGGWLAASVSNRILEKLFALLLIAIAAQLAYRAYASGDDGAG